jgi:hypothetical protein
MSRSTGHALPRRSWCWPPFRRPSRRCTNEGRAPREDPAFALLVRHLSEQIVGNPTEALEQACQLRLRERRNEPLILALLADPVGHDAPRKQVFRTECLRLLKLIAGGLGLEKADYDLRWNPGGPAVSGDACLHSDRIFVNLTQGGGLSPPSDRLF